MTERDRLEVKEFPTTFVPCCIPVIGDLMTFEDSDDEEYYEVLGLKLDDDDDLIVTLQGDDGERFDAYACELNVGI